MALITAFVIGVLALAIIPSCQHGNAAAQSAVQTALPAPPAPPQPVRFTVAAIGDILIHSTLYKAAHTGGGAYDFKPLFAQVKPYLESADYTIANLEVPVAGADRGYSGYPCFNSPVSLAYALRWSGVDLVTTANNHSLDKGWSGLASTLDNVDRTGLQHIGTHRSVEEQQTPTIVEIGGVKVGFLGYATMTNGIPIPKGKEFAVNLIGNGDPVIAAARRAREAGAQMVVAVLHWGNEYQRQPTDQQQALAKKLLAGGVDYIIAHHPHVVQPITRPTVSRNGQPYTGLVAYSLGNFVSGQRDRYRDSGIILYLTFEKSPAGGVKLVGTQYLPVYVQRGSSGGRTQYRVLPVSPQITPISDIVIGSEVRRRMEQVSEELKAHLESDSVSLLNVTE
ncbi:MAG: CapA family protein [Armatimonadota bacterium]